MTTYTTLTEAATDPFAPLTAELIKALRDNALAIGECDQTAPVNQAGWHPYNKVTNNDSNDGQVYAGTTVSSIDVTFATRYEYILYFEAVSHNSGSNQSLQFNLNNGSGWGTQTALTGFGAIAAASSYTGFIHFVVPYWNRVTHQVVTNSGGDNLSFGATTTVTQGRLIWSAGSFDAGSAWLFKRRSFNF